MLTSLHFWLRLSISFLGLWGCGWLIGIVRRRKAQRGEIIPIITPSYQLKEKARTVVVNATKIGLGAVLGMGGIDLWQYHNTDFISNVVVESQQGRYVQYHFPQDSKPRKTYAWSFCEGRYLPHFEPQQVVGEMRFVRRVENGHECEDLSPSSTYLRLKRLNGVPILATEED